MAEMTVRMMVLLIDGAFAFLDTSSATKLIFSIGRKAPIATLSYRVQVILKPRQT
jgi:hypothetical protein